MANTRKKIQKQGKRERVPFGANRQRLSVRDKDPNYVYRWVNDTEDRLERAEAGGYVFVQKSEVGKLGEGQIHQENTDLNSRVSKIVSKGETTPIRGYLMKIKKTWYDKDQKVKEALTDEVDQAIMRGRAGGAAIENQYVPRDGGVSLQRP
jgi:hypothetical protein